VEDTGGGLFLVLGPSAPRATGACRSPSDLFVYSPAQEQRQARVGVTFLIGPDGKASAVTIEDLNDYGLGTLGGLVCSRSVHRADAVSWSWLTLFADARASVSARRFLERKRLHDPEYRTV
jgi:hypothetical protein